jgi:hypothetical protein
MNSRGFSKTLGSKKILSQWQLMRVPFLMGTPPSTISSFAYLSNSDVIELKILETSRITHSRYDMALIFSKVISTSE